MKATAQFSYQGKVYQKGDAVEVDAESGAYLLKKNLVSGKAAESTEEKEPATEKKEMTMSTEKVKIKKP